MQIDPPALAAVKNNEAGGPRGPPATFADRHRVMVSRSCYLPVEPIVNVPTFRNGTSRVPTGVRTSTVPCAR